MEFFRSHWSYNNSLTHEVFSNEHDMQIFLSLNTRVENPLIFQLKPHHSFHNPSISNSEKEESSYHPTDEWSLKLLQESRAKEISKNLKFQLHLPFKNQVIREICPSPSSISKPLMIITTLFKRSNPSHQLTRPLLTPNHSSYGFSYGTYKTATGQKPGPGFFSGRRALRRSSQ